jgi:hypothetical protein
MAIGSTGRTGRHCRVTVAIPGIECAEALIGRKTVLLEAANAEVDLKNGLIKSAFAKLAVKNYKIGQKTSRSSASRDV